MKIEETYTNYKNVTHKNPLDNYYLTSKFLNYRVSDLQHYFFKPNLLNLVLPKKNMSK
jgi:hypothetical protein